MRSMTRRGGCGGTRSDSSSLTQRLQASHVCCPHLQVSVSGWLEAFAAHPRIGDVDTLRKKFASTANWCVLVTR